MPPSGIQPFPNLPVFRFHYPNLTPCPHRAGVPTANRNQGKGQEDQGDDRIANPHFPSQCLAPEPTSPIHCSTFSHADQEPRLGVLFNSIGPASHRPHPQWLLAVRLLVITSSTAQNFEINARYGPMRRVTMTTFLLLVTWLAYGQPPSDYQVPFSSNEACEAARLQLIKDAERIGQAMIERATAQDRQIGGNNKTALLMAAISNAPYVSAVCVQTSAS